MHVYASPSTDATNNQPHRGCRIRRIDVLARQIFGQLPDIRIHNHHTNRFSSFFLAILLFIGLIGTEAGLLVMASNEKRSDLIAIARDLSGVPMCDDYEKMISGMLCVFSF